MKITNPIHIYSVKQLREAIHSTAEVCSSSWKDDVKIVFMSVGDSVASEIVVVKYDKMYDVMTEESRLGNFCNFLTLDDYVSWYSNRM